ncbi:MAG: hypothetical protein ACM3O7_03430 [Acidobacteriota bacterium]
MLRVLAEVPLRDELSPSSPVNHQLAPGDLVLVESGPTRYVGEVWYQVGHHGFGGWVPLADDNQAYLALDPLDPTKDVWDLVLFGDSSSVPGDMLAQRIEERLGVEVRIHDFWGSGAGGAAANVLNTIQADAEVREAIAGAEIVSLEMNPGLTSTGDALGAVCLDNDPTPRDPPPLFTVEDFGEYADLWRGVYDEILALRAGQPTVVRVTDAYVPVLDAWKAAGIEPECTAGWEAWTRTVKLVADEYGVPVASVYDAFNGPNHDEDPVDKGYIGGDGEHPSEEGRAVYVDLLDALGYDPIESLAGGAHDGGAAGVTAVTTNCSRQYDTAVAGGSNGPPASAALHRQRSAAGSA